LSLATHWVRDFTAKSNTFFFRNMTQFIKANTLTIYHSR
jgi:hypothetical protein